MVFLPVSGEVPRQLWSLYKDQLVHHLMYKFFIRHKGQVIEYRIKLMLISSRPLGGDKVLVKFVGQILQDIHTCSKEVCKGKYILSGTPINRFKHYTELH